MRRIAAVTTCNREGYELYGRRLLESFDRHWPASVALHFYTEGFAPDVTSPRIVAHDLLAAAPDLVDFRRRHAANPDAHGRLRRRLRVVTNWSTLKVRVRRVTEEDAFRWEAVRFAHKSFALFHAAATCDAEVLFWLDADITVFADVPRSFLEGLVPEDCLVAFLARPNHTEVASSGTICATRPPNPSSPRSGSSTSMISCFARPNSTTPICSTVCDGPSRRWATAATTWRPAPA